MKRPIYLNLFKLYFPIPAIVSFLHRVSGFILVLIIPLLLWMLQKSLASEAQFNELKDTLSSIPARLFLWACLIALLYHFMAGIRHLLMDAHLGESRRGGRMSAWTVMALLGFSIIVSGIWIWK